MRTVIAVLAIVCGVFSALGIWFPRLRAHWKGTSMVCGPVTCAGGAVFFLSLGTVFLCVEAVPERYRTWFALPVIIGWILGSIGRMLDARAQSQSAPSLSASQPRAGLFAMQRDWAFIAVGVIFLILTLWSIVFHK
jgi:hypothetical protein